MKEKYRAYYRSPIGIIEIVGNEDGISNVEYMNNSAVPSNIDGEVHETLKECLTQLDEYFSSKRREFTVKINMNGTEFQRKVWTQLLSIPYGKTLSYKDIAEKVGDVKAVRAVGGANGKNKINIIVPCHRVIGLNGKLTGYGGGLWRKEWLLKHEGSIK